MLNRLQFEAQRQLYKWNTYVPTPYYRWDRYTSIENPVHTWEKHSTTSTAPLVYLWRQYDAMVSETYYCWNKRNESYQALYGWERYQNSPTTKTTVTRISDLDEYLFPGDVSIELYEQPTTSASSQVLYYGEDYWYDWEDYSGYVRYNGRWIEIQAVRNYGNGTQVEGWDISIREETVPGPGQRLDPFVVYDTDPGKYSEGLNADGIFYIPTDAITTNYYVASASSSGIPTNVVYTSTLPELDKFTGRFNIVDTTPTGYPMYGYIPGNANEYYVFPNAEKCFVMLPSIIPEGTTVQHITNYEGTGKLNPGDYYQIATGLVDYVKGNETADSPVSADNPDAYNEGYQDGFWYEFIGTSGSDQYVWDSYSIAHTEITKYIWEKYNPLYTWDTYEYTTKYSLSGSGTKRIAVFEYTLNAETGRPRYRIGDGEYANANFFLSRSSKSGNFTSPVSSLSGAVGFTGSTDGSLTILMLTNELFADNQIVMNYETSYSPYLRKGVLYAYVVESQEKGHKTGQQVSSDKIDAYEEGLKDGVWYEKAIPFRTVGTFAKQEPSYDQEEFPSDDWGEDGFYYKSKPPVVETSDEPNYDDPKGEATSTNLGDYPYPRGIQNGLYYIFSDVRVGDREVSQDYVLVESPERNTYNDNGYMPNDPDYYYYVYVGNFPTYSIGEYIEPIENPDEEYYPHYGYDERDGYFYVDNINRIRYDKGEPTEGIYVEDYYRGKYPDNAEQNGTWYVFDSSRIISIPDVPNSELYGGVTVNQQTNTNGDLQFGMTAGSSITFTVDNYDSRADAYLEAKVYHQVCFNNEIPEGQEDLDDPAIYKQMGVYYIKEVVKKRHKATITAYDSLYLLDQNADDFVLNNMTGVTVLQLVEGIAAKLGIALSPIDSTLPNLNVRVNKENIPEKNNTYRQLMSWALELMNCFLVANASGVWQIRQYEENPVTLTDNDYYDLQISDYPIPKPTRVIENTYGKSAGNEDNLYLINNNGLINSGNAQTVVSGIKYNFSNLSEYFTASLKLFTDSFGLNQVNVGDIINVSTFGVNHKIYVMSKIIQANGIYIESFGNSRRQAVFDPTTIKINQVRTIAQEAQESAVEAYQKAEEVERTTGFRIDEIAGTITGTVTFEDLAGDGRATTIKGDLIKTGTIDAKYISSDVIQVATKGAITPYNGLSSGNWTSGVQLFSWANQSSAFANYVAVSSAGAVLAYGYIRAGQDPSTPVNQVFANASRVQMQHGDGAYGSAEHYIGCDDSKCYASESLTIVSDREKKTDIEDLEYEEVFKRLRPRRYKMKDGASGRYHTGFVAQEVKDAVIDAGLTTKDFATYVEYEDQDGTQTCGLRYEELIAMNTMMIQKLMKENDELKAEIEKMKEVIK